MKNVWVGGLVAAIVTLQWVGGKSAPIRAVELNQWHIGDAAEPLQIQASPPSFGEKEAGMSLQACNAMADDIDAKGTAPRSVDSSAVRSAMINLCMVGEREFFERVKLETPSVPEPIFNGCAKGVSERTNPSFEALANCLSGMLDRTPQRLLPSGWTTYSMPGFEKKFWNDAACFHYRKAHGGVCTIH